MLKLENITVRYGEKTAVDGVSLHLREGQWLMLCGPNGAGKSTLLGAAAQSLPYIGRVLLRGQDARRIAPAAFARAVGVLQQNNTVQYAFTVEEIIRLGRYAHRRRLFSGGSAEDEQAVEQALSDAGLTALRRQNVLTLSGGELQRVFLAQVLAQRPQVLLLDEPANHLDLRYQQQLFALIGDWLRQPGHAVLSVVHDLSLARCYGTHALLMHEGKAVARGEMNGVLSADCLEAVYGMDVNGWMRRLYGLWNA